MLLKHILDLGLAVQDKPTGRKTAPHTQKQRCAIFWQEPSQNA